MRGSLVLLVAGSVFLAMVAGCGDSDDSCGDNPGWPKIPDLVDGWPKWSSADTAKIAYAHYSMTRGEYERYGDVTVWVADITTGEMQFVTPGAPADWTPDGSSILFYRSGQLFLIDLSTKQESRVTDERWPVLMADFSPCGDKIAYAVDEAGHSGIWIRDLSTSTSEWIYSGYGPDWNPNGMEIVCDSLVVINQHGERLYKFPYTPDFGYPGRARWSPDGQGIAFRANGSIWLMDADGINLRELGAEGNPTWSPDGRKLAYDAVSSDGEYTAIWIIDVDGSAARQVTFADAYPDSW